MAQGQAQSQGQGQDRGRGRGGRAVITPANRSNPGNPNNVPNLMPALMPATPVEFTNRPARRA